MISKNETIDEITTRFEPNEIFPLRLSPFEEFTHIDSRPSLPMTENATWFFEGRVDVKLLQRALNRAAACEPLFFARIRKRWGRFCWVASGKPEFPILCASQTPNTVADLRSGVIPLSVFYPGKETSIRFELIVGSDGFILRTPTYHPLGDGSAIVRFVGNWFALYEEELQKARSNSDDKTWKPSRDWNLPVPKALEERENYYYVAPEKTSFLEDLKFTLESFAVFARAPWALDDACRKARKERHKRREKLAQSSSTSGKNRRAQNSIVAEDSSIIPTPLLTHRQLTPGGEEDAISNRPRLYWQILPNDVVERVRNKAKSEGVHFNSILTRDVFVALEKWRGSVDSPKANRRLRIMTPVSLRKSEHENLPMTNMIGYVFLDRMSFEAQKNDGKFLKGLDDQMEEIKKWSIGLFFLDALRFFRKIPGAFKLLSSGPFHFATLIFSNLGPIWPLFAQPKYRAAKTIEIEGELRALRMIGAPPVRKHLPVSIGIVATGSETALTFCVDDAVVAATERETLIAAVYNEIVNE